MTEKVKAIIYMLDEPVNKLKNGVDQLKSSQVSPVLQGTNKRDAFHLSYC